MNFFFVVPSSRFFGTFGTVLVYFEGISLDSVLLWDLAFEYLLVLVADDFVCCCDWWSPSKVQLKTRLGTSFVPSGICGTQNLKQCRKAPTNR